MRQHYRHPHTIPDTVVYRWPGTRSVVTVFGPWHSGVGLYYTSFAYLHDEDDPSSSGFVFDVAEEEGRVVCRSDDRMSRTYSLVEQRQIRKKVLGFLVDVGVERRVLGGVQISAFVTSSAGVDMAWSELPRWVENGAWDDRYASADRYASWDQLLEPLLDDPWLGYVADLRIRLDADSGAEALWGRKIRSYDLPKRAGADSVQELVDALVKEEKLLPEQERAAWLAENLTFGELVVPSPDEAEVFRAIGERLPLLWPSRQLATWLSERG